MHPLQRFDVVYEKPPAEQALALQLVTETDLLRLKAVARLHTHQLPPDVSWSDLLQEAFARVLAGSRHRPEGLAMLPFLAGVMRSIKAEHWRRARREARQLPKLLGDLESADSGQVEALDPAPTLESSLAAMQEIAIIYKLFADDPQARQIMTGLAEERSPEEICKRCGMSKTDYDSTRRRMRRLLLREGLRLMPI
jgi:DNA-directed RNA polymerase specialized sigma24 family protein